MRAIIETFVALDDDVAGVCARVAPMVEDQRGG